MVIAMKMRDSEGACKATPLLRRRLGGGLAMQKIAEDDRTGWRRRRRVAAVFNAFRHYPRNRADNLFRRNRGERAGPQWTCNR